MPDTRQLPFDFPHVPHFTEAEFLPTEANHAALSFLSSEATWPSGRLALWGESGTGKTHLLHMWATRTGASILPPRDLPVWPGGPVAIDDADRVLDEEALLHLLNAAAEAGHAVLLAARTPPARRDVGLPDLRSRLRATTAVEIGPADDAFLAELLARLTAARQFTLGSALQAWLLTRLPRHPGAIRDAVARLDVAGLAAGSAVTRSMAAEVLADLLDGHTEISPPLARFG